MDPVFGFIVFIVLFAVVWFVANKRGRLGFMWALNMLIVVVLAVFFVTGMTHGNGTAAGSIGLTIPVLTLILLLLLPNAQDMASRDGEFGDYRKCPYCAEAVRREAVKCKHCGSSIAPDDLAAS